MQDLFGKTPEDHDNGEDHDDTSTEQAKAPVRHPVEGLFDPRPLADRMRPLRFEDYLGQEELLGEDAPLRKLIHSARVPSMILWGPPGSGKTTLARLIADVVQSDFVSLSAVTSTVRDVRQVIDTAKTNLKFQRRTILFIDEIHRFNKSQQDAFLPHVESGIVTLIGATTENPSFSVIAPLLSRCRVYTLKALGDEHLETLVQKGIRRLNHDRPADQHEVQLDNEAVRAIVGLSDGDARRALGMLELAASVKVASADDTPVTAPDIASISQRHLIYDKTGEEHYNLISALHKSLRSSDPHGAIYWMGRMIAAGEDPRYVARRIIRFASEDVGLAEPNALLMAMEALRAYESLGSPEGELAIVQAAVYLALAPKSNSLYRAWGDVMREINQSGSLPVPMHLRNAPTRLMKDIGYGDGYTYDHDAEGHFIAKQSLPDEIAGRRFYEPSDQGAEKRFAERLEQWDKQRDNISKKKRKNPG